MMNAFPEKIGWLNGLPAEDRDEANRLHLAQQPGDPRLRALQRQLGQLDAAGKDPYLLGIDPKSHDGRAIVAVGNPDHARHTGVLVPGVGNDLSNVGETIARAERLTSQASAYSGPGQVSTIAWLGYDTPGFGNAASYAPADQGAPALSQFVDGVRQAQSDAGVNNGHVTAIGHSYGSVVVGEAAKHGGLHVDDIAVAGSPGMHVDNASQLHVGAGHVWAQEAAGDPIPDFGQISHGGDDGPYGFKPEMEPRPIPTDESFGAHQMKTDTQGHSAYWGIRPDGTPTESLRNQARVIAGRYGDISSTRGHPS
jgi:predicted esterase